MNLINNQLFNQEVFSRECIKDNGTYTIENKNWNFSYLILIKNIQNQQVLNNLEIKMEELDGFINKQF